MALDKEKAIEKLRIPAELYDQILQAFIQQAGESIKKINALRSAGDFEQVKKQGHFIKGAAGNLSIEEMYLVAKEIEYFDCEKGDIHSLDNNIAKLTRAFEELKKQA